MTRVLSFFFFTSLIHYSDGGNSRMNSRISRPIILISLLALLMGICGCAVTKVAAVPMRVSGAALSVVPVVGNTAHTMIDTTADIID